MRAQTALKPDACALIIVDLQKGYCDPGSDAATGLGWDVTGADAVAQRHVAFLEKVRQVLPSERILWLKMEEAEATYASNTHYGPGQPKDTNSDHRFFPLCIRGTPGHEYHCVVPQDGEAEFLKFHPSGFYNPAFHQYLKKHEIRQLIFTGVIASRCVNATLITASSLGFECGIITDLVAGPAHLAREIEEHTKLTAFFYAAPFSASQFLSGISAL